MYCWSKQNMKGLIMPFKTVLTVVLLYCNIGLFGAQNERLAVDEIYACLAVEDMNPVGVNTVPGDFRTA